MKEVDKAILLKDYFIAGVAVSAAFLVGTAALILFSMFSEIVELADVKTAVVIAACAGTVVFCLLNLKCLRKPGWFVALALGNLIGSFGFVLLAELSAQSDLDGLHASILGALIVWMIAPIWMQFVPRAFVCRAPSI